MPLDCQNIKHFWKKKDHRGTRKFAQPLLAKAQVMRGAYPCPKVFEPIFLIPQLFWLGEELFRVKF